MAIKRYRADDVLTAARRRIAETFDSVERVYLAFSGGKDSSVLFHLVMEEAIKRGQRVGVMFIDFEAQYAETISHVHEMFELYKDHIEQHWICIPMLLRNAVTNFEPRWVCWDETKKPLWIRDKPAGCTTEKRLPVRATADGVRGIHRAVRPVVRPGQTDSRVHRDTRARKACIGTAR